MRRGSRDKHAKGQDQLFHVEIVAEDAERMQAERLLTFHFHGPALAGVDQQVVGISWEVEGRRVLSGGGEPRQDRED